MNVAQMMVIREMYLIVWFSANCDFIFFRKDKAEVLVGAINNLEGNKMFICHTNFELIGANLQNDALD